MNYIIYGFILGIIGLILGRCLNISLQSPKKQQESKQQEQKNN